MPSGHTPRCRLFREHGSFQRFPSVELRHGVEHGRHARRRRTRAMVPDCPAASTGRRQRSRAGLSGVSGRMGTLGRWTFPPPPPSPSPPPSSCSPARPPCCCGASDADRTRGGGGTGREARGEARRRYGGCPTRRRLVRSADGAPPGDVEPFPRPSWPGNRSPGPGAGCWPFSAPALLCCRLRRAGAGMAAYLRRPARPHRDPSSPG